MPLWDGTPATELWAGPAAEAARESVYFSHEARAGCLWVCCHLLPRHGLQVLSTTPASKNQHGHRDGIPNSSVPLRMYLEQHNLK